MSLGLNGWDMHNVNKAMIDMTLFEIICLYQDKEQELMSTYSEYPQVLRENNEPGMERIDKECERLEKEKCVIALRIADEISKERIRTR